MSGLLKSAFLAASLTFAGAYASAATVVYDDGTGYVIGIDELVVDGTLLYMSVESGSFDTVFGASLPYFFGDEATASLAADEIRDVLNSEVGVPEIALGSSEILWVPTAFVDPDSFQAEQVGHVTDADPWQRFADFQGARSVDYSGAPNSWLFATFSTTPRPVGTVPEPGTALLFAAGLFGLRRWYSGRSIS